MRKMENYKIGHRIKTMRKSKGITQEQLSETINVSPHYIYEIERGLKQMSLETFISITHALNTSADYLLFGTPHCDDPDSGYNEQLDNIIRSLSPHKREAITKIIHTLLPLLK